VIGPARVSTNLDLNILDMFQQGRSVIGSKTFEMASLPNDNVLKRHIAKHDIRHAFSQASMGQVCVLEISLTARQ